MPWALQLLSTCDAGLHFCHLPVEAPRQAAFEETGRQNSVVFQLADMDSAASCSEAVKSNVQ